MARRVIPKTICFIIVLTAANITVLKKLTNLSSVFNVVKRDRVDANG
jgi:hypothetical protein